jgi:hypothetical protein
LLTTTAVRFLQDEGLARSIVMSATLLPRYPSWLPPLAEEEFEAISNLICLRIQDGTMPPDDAYWWTRVLVADAVCTLMWNGTDAEQAGEITATVNGSPSPS